MSAQTVVKPGAQAAPCGLLSESTRQFSLVLGGPFYQYLRRIGLIRPPLDRVGWRMIVIPALAWVPLLILTALSGRVTGGVRIPFLFDVEVQCRFLLMLPLLIGAEFTINRRTRTMLLEFVERQIITAAGLPRFERIADSALRLRDSAGVEAGLVALVFTAGVFLSRTVAISADTWYATAVPGGRTLTSAGYWYQFVSIPVIQFILLRWYFRLFLWGRLLWQISRLDLNLVPTHPDRCCGLAFLGESAFALAPFLVAHSVLLAGYLANRILYTGAKLPDYRIEILIVAIFLFLLGLGPTCVFTPRLLRRRWEGLATYGALASEYVIGFERKWVNGERRADEPLVGSSDVQSLADMANSFSVVEGIRPVPFGRAAIVAVVLFAVLPILPLTFTMFSFQEMVTRLVKVLL